jgi:predicted nucleic acid-binding protein
MNAVFVDSNILIYSQDATDSRKQAQALGWLEHLWRTRTGRISFQVLREVYVNVTQKVPIPLPAVRARNLVRLFLVWNPRPEDPEFFEVAWNFETSFQLSWWDSMIASAAHLSECRYLLTEDLQGGMSLNKLTVINPFSTSWESFARETRERP